VKGEDEWVKGRVTLKGCERRRRKKEVSGGGRGERMRMIGGW